MSYNILDAIRDEIALCRDTEKLVKDKVIISMFYREQANSLTRILDRLEKGIDFSIDFEKKSICRNYTNRKSDEMLERENISLQKAGENYRLIRELVSD